ncbi:MAG: LysM peptidoglycan-binding domain-containing protein [Bacteroidetes bacterium]|nr:MAG: LysM peptidoglycan-binding domain-containing protein [Bacteroidota bacterium]
MPAKKRGFVKPDLMNKMRKRLFLILGLMGWCICGRATTGDSLHFLTPADTIFITMNNYQEKIFVHRLEKGQTLWSLARFYGLKLDELYAWNPRLKTEGYHPGDEVQIPIPNRAILRYRTPDFIESEFVPLYYVVKRGDTFYGISRRYFKMPIDTIVRRNNLPTLTLHNGQALHIGWMSIHGIPDSLRRVHGGPLWEKSYALRMHYFQQKFSKKEYTERGAAQWYPSEKGGNDLYALHPYAPIGSVISIRNPVYNRTIYVKVIGRLPARVHDRKRTKVVVSPTVAKMLGAIDPRFFVEIHYLK